MKLVLAMQMRIPKKLITVIILSGFMNYSLSGYTDDRLLKKAGEITYGTVVCLSGVLMYCYEKLKLSCRK